MSSTSTVIYYKAVNSTEMDGLTPVAVGNTEPSAIHNLSIPHTCPVSETTECFPGFPPILHELICQKKTNKKLNQITLVNEIRVGIGLNKAREKK